MQPRPLLILGLSLGLAASAAAQGKRLELSDLQRLVNVADPALSPDGKTVACVVSRVNWSDDRFDQELVLVEVATGAQRQLTFDRKRSEEHTSELQSLTNLVCRLLLEKKK